MYFSVLSAPNPRMTSCTGVPKSPPPHPPLPPLPRHHFGVKRVISPGKRGPKMGENGGKWGGNCADLHNVRVGCGHFAPTRCRIISKDKYGLFCLYAI